VLSHPSILYGRPRRRHPRRAYRLVFFFLDTFLSFSVTPHASTPTPPTSSLVPAILSLCIPPVSPVTSFQVNLALTRFTRHSPQRRDRREGGSLTSVRPRSHRSSRHPVNTAHPLASMARPQDCLFYRVLSFAGQVPKLSCGVDRVHGTHVMTSRANCSDRSEIDLLSRDVDGMDGGSSGWSVNDVSQADRLPNTRTRVNTTRAPAGKEHDAQVRCTVCSLWCACRRSDCRCRSPCAA